MVQNIESGASPEQAAKEGLDYMYRRVGGSGGVITLDAEGRLVRSQEMIFI